MTDTRSDSAYKQAGVDIDAQDRALEDVKGLARSTFTPGVLSEVGSFGGLFQLDLIGMEQPVLVASADGVGTKLMVARMVGDYSSVGVDLVNHCVNDILVQGAKPLFFLDYVGAGVLEEKAMVELVSGVAAACRENGCALLGGETAEMPGFYSPGDYELAGFIVGMVDRANVLDGSRVRDGDALIGLPSSGFHTNGYSLARRVFFDLAGLGVSDPSPVGGWATVGDVLLESHLSYAPALASALGDPRLHGLAHITGGGLTDNLPRILPGGLAARIDASSWSVPELFEYVEETGQVAREEMLRVFNMGVGMVAIVAADFAEELVSDLEKALDPKWGRPWVLGSVEASGEGLQVRYE